MKTYEKLEVFIKDCKSKLNLNIDASKLWLELPGLTDKNGNEYQIHYLGLRIRDKKTKQNYTGQWNNGQWRSNSTKKFKYNNGKLKLWGFSALQTIANGTYIPGNDVHHNNGLTLFNYKENVQSVDKKQHKKLHKNMQTNNRSKLLEIVLPGNNITPENLTETEFSYLVYTLIKSK